MSKLSHNKSSNKIILVTGGARSGKSRFAEKYASELSFEWDGETVYLATAQILDEEMKLRIVQHREQRSSAWRTIEEPIDLESIFLQLSQEQVSVVLLDCITLWISNLCFELDGKGQEVWVNPNYSTILFKRIERLVKLIKSAPFTTIMVTNEVGASIVPETPLGRVYRDLIGHVNQMLAASSDEVFFVVCGFPINLRQVATVPWLNSSN